MNSNWFDNGHSVTSYRVALRPHVYATFQSVILNSDNYPLLKLSR